MELEFNLDHPKRLAEAFSNSCLEQDVDPRDFTIAVYILYFTVKTNAPTFCEILDEVLSPTLKDEAKKNA